ncbi:hypothetical protein GpartN1_g7105.t1 [Galdieria partita]|uniref:O-fucosyltransferase family protein n=1 Tax=Galdieria partita TaxID=83374 RepID=A0A9C7Q2V3_9RHOD|nr:hypothetical protein GpartN1_g7105.t1 [Galdieria partita]
MIQRTRKPRTILLWWRLDNKKKRLATLIVIGWLCWILYKGVQQARNNRRQAYFHRILDSVVLGTIPKGPIRFLYYDNILTQCDCPYLPQGVIDPTNYAALLSSKDNNHSLSNRPWEAIYAMPGISHARTNLACLLQEATLLGAIAVLPAVCLSPIHNHNRLIRTHWSSYLYMEKLEQGFPIVWNVSLLEAKLQDAFQEYADGLLFPLRRNCMLSSFNPTMTQSYPRKEPRVEEFLSSKLPKYPLMAIFSEKTPTFVLQQSKANILIRQFHTNQEYMVCSPSWNHPKIQNVWSYFWSSAETDPLPAVQYIRSLYDTSDSFFCLHLRRGDKLKESRYPCLDVLTRGPHIYSVLQNASVPCGMKIYVLSNENETQLDQLLFNWNRTDRYSCDYHWIYRHHIPYLQPSKYIQDNYLLYETEKRICSYAIGYVETHRTHSSYQYLQPWNLRLTPYEEECGKNNSPHCQLNCTEYER